MSNKQEYTKQWGEEVFPLLSWFKMDKVRNAKVMVVGAGALGNEVLKNLALFGVGNIVVVDFDEIEYSNLTRSVLFRPEDADKGFFKAKVAAKRLQEINPTINTQAICGDLSKDAGLGVYRRMDVVVGCLDSLKARVLLNRMCFRAGKIWIEGGIGDLEGQVTAYQLNKNCYECSLSQDENIPGDGNTEANRTSCPQIAQGNAARGRVATTPVSASLIGAVQAQEVMKIIHGDDLKSGGFETLVGKMFHYEGKHTQSTLFDFSSYENECISHEYWENIVEIPELSADSTIAEALEFIKKRLKVDSVTINLRNDKFVDFLSSRSSNQKYNTMMPASKIPDFIDAHKELEYLTIADGGLYQHSYEDIDEEFPYPQLTLKQIGIPYLDVLQLTTENGYEYVELSADIKLFQKLFGQ
ncbi:MAG: ThiF family adenylyltransferase [Bacteroidales bacterium]|jgi:adenylyltransferase/sulfurtransferase|nr:ThiF family adenylyltransferase [Bacteroidales bacterium]